MSDPSIRAKFATLYEALPEGAQRELLEEHLFPLIDGLSSMSKMKILSAAQNAESRYADMPRLDLATKKAEVDTLFDELKRDAIHGPISSRREEIIAEIVDSLVSWLSDIWQVVYEYGVDFEKAHKCLLFCSKALHQVNTTGSSCKCGFLNMNMYIPVTIKDRRGTTIKFFSYPGTHDLEDAFLWIWRDMLLRMLAEGKSRDVARIPQMLDEIQSANNDWTSLDRILVAGGKIPLDEDEDDTDYEEEGGAVEDLTCCPRHAQHWPADVLDQIPALRALISDSLFATFKLTPSLQLYQSISILTSASLPQLLAHLRAAVTYSGAAAAAALDIHSSNGDTTSILEVFDSARTLFRPCDTPSMQHAVHVLSHTKQHLGAALEIVARELRDCLEVMRGLIVAAAFGGVDKPESRLQLGEVMKIRFNTAQRRERVERWVDSVATGTPPSGNPLTFAAFLMGFPPGFEPEDAEEPDPFLFTGIKESDPEYEDLRDEWRPRLKERFEGWVAQAETLRSGGQALLTEIAKTAGEIMPYTRGSDIIEEMITRIQEKPTRYHICDALDALSGFMKTQRKKAIAEKNKAEKRKKTASSGTSKTNGSIPGPSSDWLDEPSSPEATAGSSAGPGSSAVLDAHLLPPFLDDGGDDDDIMPGLEALD